VRGQRLFIRPIESGDAGVLRRFFAANDHPGEPPDLGLIGKLVGDVVAVLEMELTADAIRIANLFVAPELRRKRVGRYMVDELGRLARKMDRDRLTVRAGNEAAEFFRRIGFEDGELEMVRKLT